MGLYFQDLAKRKSILSQMSVKFDLGVDTEKLIELSHNNEHDHTALEEEALDPVAWTWLRKNYFEPDLVLLAKTLSGAIGGGLLLADYMGPGGAEDVRTFLKKNW